MSYRIVDLTMDHVRKVLEEHEARMEESYENSRRMDAEAFEKLRRFEEREPLVQELLQALPFDRDRPSVAAAIAQNIRSFELSPCTADAPETTAIAASTSPDEPTDSSESLNNPNR